MKVAENMRISPRYVQQLLEVSGTALEGHAPMRCVILEFQDIAHAHAWHQSPEFQHAREIGHSCLADVNVLLIPGFEQAAQAAE
jgi:uncharacterized protein (DUF1330 family)